MHILVELRGGLGDELCLTPIYKALKNKYEECHITAFVIHPEMLLLNPSVDECLKIGKHKVNKRSFNKIIPMRWQTGNYLKHSNMHLVDFFAMQAGFGQLEDKQLVFNLCDNDRNILRSLNLPKDRPIVTFDAYGNKEANRWGSKYFREVISQLKKEHNAIIIQIGTHSYGIPYVDHLLSRDYRQAKKKPDIGIREMASVIQASDLYIGNNSGAAHIASAVKTPSVKIYGCTDHKLYTHDENLEFPAFLEKLECQGCQNKKPGENPIHKSKNYFCPEKDFKCLIDLYPFFVVEKAEKVLENFYYKNIRNINGLNI